MEPFANSIDTAPEQPTYLPLTWTCDDVPWSACRRTLSLLQPAVFTRFASHFSALLANSLTANSGKRNPIRLHLHRTPLPPPPGTPSRRHQQRHSPSNSSYSPAPISRPTFSPSAMPSSTPPASGSSSCRSPTASSPPTTPPPTSPPHRRPSVRQ